MKLKKLSILVSFFLSLTYVYADDSWITDFDTALTEASNHNKPILINFTGSDWCGWCIKLDKEVFGQAAFKQFADDKLTLVKIDFPRRKKQSVELVAQNEKLLEKYGVRGFPTILLLSPKGELLAKTGYKAGGAEVYIEHIKDIIDK